MTAGTRRALLLGLLILAIYHPPGSVRTRDRLRADRTAAGPHRRQTVQAYRAGDNALVPLGAFFELAEMRWSRRPDGTLEAMIQPGNVPFMIDPASRTLRAGSTRLPSPPAN